MYVHDNTKILIDCGTTAKYIKSCLAQFDLCPGDLTHILITHAHSDHISALPVLKKHTNAQFLCTGDTEDAIRRRNPDFEAQIFEAGDLLSLNDICVQTFATPHDIVGSCGFVLDNKVAYCTDLGRVEPEIFQCIKSVETVFIESNHDVDMLNRGPYPYNLKCRILSPYGHLSNEDCGRTVEKLANSGAKCIILAHLSDKNNTPAHARAQGKMALMRAGAEEDVTLIIAPKSDVMKPVLL